VVVDPLTTAGGPGRECIVSADGVKR